MTSSAGDPPVPALMEGGGSINRPDLISSVRQLVSSVSASLKASSTAASGIEEAMAKLEATDENFNRFGSLANKWEEKRVCIGGLYNMIK